MDSSVEFRIPILDVAREAYALCFRSPWPLAQRLLPALALGLGITTVMPRVATDLGWIAVCAIQFSPHALLAALQHRSTLTTFGRRPVHGVAHTVGVFIFIFAVGTPLNVWVSTVLDSHIDGEQRAVIVAVIVSEIVSVYLLARLSLFLPALAYGKQDLLRAAWSLGRGNGWRLAILSVVVPLPIYLVLMGLFAGGIDRQCGGDIATLCRTLLLTAKFIMVALEATALTIVLLRAQASMSLAAARPDQGQGI